MNDIIHQLKKEEFMTFYDKAVVIYKLDGKIKVKQAVHLVTVGIVRGAFGGMLRQILALFLLIAKWTEEKALDSVHT
jgi:uncharacterized membrane protein